MIREDVGLYLGLTINQLVLCVDVEGGEFAEIDPVVSVEVSLLKQLVNDLDSVVFIDSLAGQKVVHFFAVDTSVLVFINGIELHPQTLYFWDLAVTKVPSTRRCSIRE